MSSDPWEECEAKEPPNSFREIPSLPEPEELKDIMDIHSTYLRRIKLGEKYKDADHYLDVQYRLLREDFVRPLKDGIRAFKLGEERLTTYKISAISKKEISYFNGNDMYHADIELTSDQRQAESDILTSSDLVAISSDQFTHDIHLAVVDDVRFEKSSEITLYMEDESRLDQSANYVLVKCLSFLPAYKHVLENLKNLSPFSPIPFERYLVYGKTDVMAPAYQANEKTLSQRKEEAGVVNYYERKRAVEMIRRQEVNPRHGFPNMDIDEINEANNDLDEPIIKNHYANEINRRRVRIDDEWYNLDNLENTFRPSYLNESQREAFCYGLKSELSFIQGPPGTGKTYIGVNLLKTILLNRSNWGINSPILVCCFSNDGLDNFLESAYEMINNLSNVNRINEPPKLVRFGSNSNSKILKKNNIIRSDVKRLYHYNGNRNASYYFEKKNVVVSKMQQLITLVRISNKYILKFSILSPFMGAEMKRAFEVHAGRELLTNDEAFAEWLVGEDLNNDEDVLDDIYAFDDDFEFAYGDRDCDKDLDRMACRFNNNVSLRDRTRNIHDEELNKAEFNFSTTWKMFKKEVGLTEMILPRNSGKFHELYKIRQRIFDTKTKRGTTNYAGDVFAMPLTQRWQLYNNLVCDLRLRCQEEIKRLGKEYRETTADLRKKLNREEANFFKNSLVIGATTSGLAASIEIFKLIRPKVVIIDEAAEILEAHTLTTFLPSVEHAICLGDHQQLKPNATVDELKSDYGLDTSMFERLISHGFPHVTLQRQYRMNTDITSMIIRPHFYPMIIDEENVKVYPKMMGMRHRLQFYTHEELETQTVKKSYVNCYEAQMVAELVKHLLNFYHQDQISVIATYSAQKEYILQLLTLNNFHGVHTVDSFQGKENTIIILSLVRSNQTGNIGFLELSNRMCVALSRAKHGFYLFGNAELLSNNSKLWKSIVKGIEVNGRLNPYITLECERHENLVEVHSPADMIKKSPNGGCAEVCGSRMACGHPCQKTCHPLPKSDSVMKFRHVCKLCG